MLDQNDKKYVEETIYSWLSNNEELVHSIRKQLRLFLSKNLKDKQQVDMKYTFFENKTKLLALKIITDFLENNNLQATLSMLKLECGELLNSPSLELDDFLEEAAKNKIEIVDETDIEKLFRYALYYKTNSEIDEITNSALVEASSCIESLQNEIQNLHFTYLEQVNAARSIMEEKVKNIEKLYLESLNKD